MRKLTSLTLFALLLAAAGYAARRLLGGRPNEWQTLGATPSPAASAVTADMPADAAAPEPAGTASPDPFGDVPADSLQPTLAPEPIDLAEPADLDEDADERQEPAASNGKKPFDPLTDPLPDEDLE